MRTTPVRPRLDCLPHGSGSPWSFPLGCSCRMAMVSSLFRELLQGRRASASFSLASMSRAVIRLPVRASFSLSSILRSLSSACGNASACPASSRAISDMLGSGSWFPPIGNVVSPRWRSSGPVRPSAGPAIPTAWWGRGTARRTSIPGVPGRVP